MAQRLLTSSSPTAARLVPRAGRTFGVVAPAAAHKPAESHTPRAKSLRLFCGTLRHSKKYDALKSSSFANETGPYLDMPAPPQTRPTGNIVASPNRGAKELDAEGIFYTMACGIAADALTPAPVRRHGLLAAETLRELGLLNRRDRDTGMDIRDNEPVWPPVRVFAKDGARRDVFDPTTGERLASIRSAQWAHVDAALTRAQEAQRRWAKLSGGAVKHAKSQTLSYCPVATSQLSRPRRNSTSTSTTSTSRTRTRRALLVVFTASQRLLHVRFF